jgi:FAD/FMN-containing dehydrogenase
VAEGGGTKAITLDGTYLQLSPSDIAQLKGRLRGSLLLDGDEGYDESRKLWNGMIDRRPAMVVRPTGTADVVECVNFVRKHGIMLSIRGAGHNIAGTAIADGGLALDMSKMRGVFVDSKSRRAQAQAGCVLGDVDRETQLHGLVTALGFVSETGIAGLTLGGGFGYLTRRFGWTVDNLLEVEMVTADSRVLRANESDHPDLFWAVRGGGGNFGVVTSFTYRLHPLGPKIVGGIIAWPADRAKEVLELYREATMSAPRELTLVLAMRFAPSAAFVPSEWHGKPIIAFIACHSGTTDQATEDLKRIREFGGAIFDMVVEKNYTAQQSMLDTTQPRGNHYYWKSEFYPGLPDRALDIIRERGAQETSSLSQMVLFHVEGAIGERKADDGAVGNRDAAYVMVVVNGWHPDDPDGKRHIAWVRSTWDQLRPFSTGGVYINFQTADEGEERIRASYGQNFNRLAQIKAKYDPHNLFRVNRNVSPAS